MPKAESGRGSRGEGSEPPPHQLSVGSLRFGEEPRPQMHFGRISVFGALPIFDSWRGYCHQFPWLRLLFQSVSQSVSSHVNIGYKMFLSKKKQFTNNSNYGSVCI